MTIQSVQFGRLSATGRKTLTQAEQRYLELRQQYSDIPTLEQIKQPLKQAPHSTLQLVQGNFSNIDFLNQRTGRLTSPEAMARNQAEQRLLTLLNQSLDKLEALLKGKQR